MGVRSENLEGFTVHMTSNQSWWQSSSVIVTDNVYTPPPSASKFLFQMPVNQLVCRCPMFGMILIIVLMCTKSPLGLKVKLDKVR